jgi:flagellar M-ring protein FliF
VAVFVDGKYEANKYVGRSAEEMEVIKGMVKRAIGFDAERGDEMEVANVPFKIQPAAPAPSAVPPTLKEMVQTPMGMGAAAGILLVVGGLLFFMLRGKKKPVLVEESRPALAAAVEMAPTAQAVQEEMAVAAQKIVLSQDPRKEQLSQIAQDYHDATVRIIRTWLQEDAAKGRAATGTSVTA